MATLVVLNTRHWPTLAISSAAKAGLMVGLVESLFFTYVLARAPLRRALGLRLNLSGSADGVDAGVVAVIVLLTIGAGVAFGRMLRTDVAWWRIALGGISLLAASLLGVTIASSIEPLQSSLSTVRTFQLAFTAASACVALLCACSAGWLLRIDRTVRKAALVGVATGAAYLAFALAIDLLPGWRVGGGDMAMPRVAMLGNLFSGSIGGMLAFALLARRYR
jgi:hypothetical protein